MNYCVGVDVGGTTVKIGLFEVTGMLLKKWEIPSRAEDGGKAILPDTAASIIAKLKELNIDMDNITGVGLGVPGPVMPDGFVCTCVNLGWRNINPEKILSGLLNGIKVKASNDANVAALGEMWQGGGRGYNNLVAITLGTGVGGGIIVDKKILNGAHGMGGEIGHIRVVPDMEDICNCNNHGCLEQVASATGMVRVMKKALTESEEPSILRDMEKLSAREMLNAAKGGDNLAYETVSTCMYYLALVMSHVTMVMDPEVFVIGGGVSRAGEFLRSMVEKHFNKLIFLSEDKPEIVLATLGNDAGIYGAARMILEK